MTDQTDAKPKRGRPKGSGSKWTPEIEDKICAYLVTGASLRETCRKDDIPVAPQTVLDRVTENESFARRYARAREIGFAQQFEEMREIARDCLPNNGDVQKAKLEVDVIKWQLSKMLPGTYGDRVNLEHTGRDGGPIKSEAIEPRDLARSVLDVLAEAGEGADLGSVMAMVEGEHNTRH